MKPHVAMLGIAVCLCLGAFLAVVCADSFVLQPLFTLPYGSGLGQIGVWLPQPGSEEGRPEGPSSIAVGRDGSIYIADSVNKRIQRFSKSGELLMEAKGPLDRHIEHIAAEVARGWGGERLSRLMQLENIEDIAVDSQGSVYVLFGAALDMLAKFTADGQGLWYMAIPDALPLDVRKTYGPFYGNLTYGPDDTLCMRISGRAVDGIAMFDADGHFLKAVSGYACTPGGRIAALTRSTGGGLAATIRLYDTSGVELSSFVAEPPATDGTLLSGDGSFYRSAFDGSDHLYRFAQGLRANRIILSDVLSIGTDTVVVRYDAGRAVAGIRFPGSPFPAPRHVSVDYSGNIYRLAFGADSVDVMKYVLDTSTPEYSSLRED